MSYVFESKKDLLYHQNYLALTRAIQNAGGDPEKIVDGTVDSLLADLARNEIKINAEYIGNQG